jgi:hypothetical protein
MATQTTSAAELVPPAAPSPPCAVPPPAAVVAACARPRAGEVEAFTPRQSRGCETTKRDEALGGLVDDLRFVIAAVAGH